MLRQLASAELGLGLKLRDAEADASGLHAGRHKSQGAGQNAPSLLFLDRFGRLARGLRLQPATEGVQMDGLPDLVVCEPGDIEILPGASSPKEEASRLM